MKISKYWNLFGFFLFFVFYQELFHRSCLKLRFGRIWKNFFKNKLDYWFSYFQIRTTFARVEIHYFLLRHRLRETAFYYTFWRASFWTYKYNFHGHFDSFSAAEQLESGTKSFNSGLINTGWCKIIFLCVCLCVFVLWCFTFPLKRPQRELKVYWLLFVFGGASMLVDSFRITKEKWEHQI